MTSTEKSKIYTRTGDRGETSLIGGQRVKKDALRVEAYGTIDELNAAIGASASFINNRDLASLLQLIQNELFNIGAELSSLKKLKKDDKLYELNKEKITVLEEAIDLYDSKLPPLRNFILPGGSKTGSLLHLARTICRRAERRLVALARKEALNENIVVYINRLSDLLFVLARFLNKREGMEEIPWGKNLS